MNWTGRTTSSDQGLISDDETGKTIAVAYDPKHTALIAAAPTLLASCKAWLNDDVDDGEFADTLRLIVAEVEKETKEQS